MIAQVWETGTGISNTSITVEPDRDHAAQQHEPHQHTDTGDRRHEDVERVESPSHRRGYFASASRPELIRSRSSGVTGDS